MSRGDLMHAVHELSHFNSITSDGYKTVGDNFYYHSSKRKRKTSAPQKLEVSGDEMEDEKTVSGLNRMEPINLMNKDTKYDLPKENNECIPMNSSDQSRIYNTLLNYLMLKYQIPFGNENESLISSVVNRSAHKISDIRIPNNPYSMSGTVCNSELPSFGDQRFCNKSSSDSESPCKDAPIFCDGIESKDRMGNSTVEDTPELSISQAINACIHSIPIPRTGYNNYDAMLLCYKSLVEKAYSLQNSIDMYVNLLQNIPILNTGDNKNVNGPRTSPLNVTPDICHDTHCSTSQATKFGEIKYGSNALLSAALADSQHILQQQLPQQQHLQNTPFGWIPDIDDSYKYTSNTDYGGAVPNPLQLSDNNSLNPVDLTMNDDKSPARCPNSSFNCSTPKSCLQVSEKNDENIKKSLIGLMHYNGQDTPNVTCSANLSEHSGVSSGKPSPLEDRFGMTQIQTPHQDFKSTYRQNTCSPSYLGDVDPFSERASLLQKRKPYFKTKKTKKLFSITSTPSTNDEINSSCGMKKSNFRGTSEEENKVSPDFKPTELNGQILLAECHPNVKLSKDIFYSLIVKSSGSATRLIRLLMKSFFTQEELAASSLSGEGIYKQRLEPSVTEAIKIFIRRRHPQLKTGSINLCMTDVCVQARRVANNQRSRQHPLRPNNTFSQGEVRSITSSNEDGAPETGASNASLMLGLKTRSLPIEPTMDGTVSTFERDLNNGLENEDRPVFMTDSDRERWSHDSSAPAVDVGKEDSDPMRSSTSCGSSFTPPVNDGHTSSLHQFSPNSLSVDSQSSD